ncbi:MAG: rhomboid family intramembrane serine protease [Bacteroidales bacterium]|nr:rhomboid family intramembrane serine protease [Bacteroidales bacterium]
MNYYNRGGGFFNSLPRVTRILLIINIAAFAVTWLLSSMGYANMNTLLGLHNFLPGSYSSPAGSNFEPLTFTPVQIITHMFLHGGLGHIFFNMFGLVMFGKVLETVLGEKKFFILYFVSGLGAALLQLGINYYFDAAMASQIMEFYKSPDPDVFFNLLRELDYNEGYLLSPSKLNGLVEYWQEHPNDLSSAEVARIAIDKLYLYRISIPMVGASGALMGILAAFALYFPNVELMLLFIPVPIKAKYFIPIFVLASLFLGVSNIALTNVAHFAHLGGAVFGFVLAYIWKRNQFKIL